MHKFKLAYYNLGIVSRDPNMQLSLVGKYGDFYMEMFFAALTMGVLATLAIDIWAEFLGRGLKLPTTNWGMVGRWFGHLPKGRFVHRPITSSTPVHFERAIGWVLHYVIGIIYAILYLALVQGAPGLSSAFLFGLVTVLVPWLVLQPGLGLGCFARRSPRPNVLRAMSLSIHSIFGTTLYLGWLVSQSFVW